jgi:hypothetical protein
MRSLQIRYLRRPLLASAALELALLLGGLLIVYAGDVKKFWRDHAEGYGFLKHLPLHG